MCSKFNLEMGLLSVHGFILLSSIYFFVMGGILINNNHVHEAYGTRFKHVGGGFVSIAVFLIIVTLIGLYARRNHNKVLLSLYSVLAVGLFLPIFFMSLDVALTGVINYSRAFQVDCLSAAPSVRTIEECDVFLNDHTRAGLRLLWASYFAEAQTNDAIYQDLIELQREGNCCGFGPPLRCVEDSRPPPSDLLNNGETQRRECGVGEGWYPASYRCNQVIDPSQTPVVLGGCRYDMAVGACIDDPVQAFSRGCSYELQVWYASMVAPMGYVGIVMSMAPIFGVFASICLCLKRQRRDVLPVSETHVPDAMQYSHKKTNKMNQYADKQAMIEELKAQAKAREERIVQRKMGL